MSVQFVENTGSKPSAADLASFASRANDIDLGDDIVDLSDDLGIGLLANQNKISPSPKQLRQVNMSVGGSGPTLGSAGSNDFGGGGGMPALQIKPIDDLDVVNLEAAPGVSDIKIEHSSDSLPFVVTPEVANGGGGYQQEPGMSPDAERKEKQRLVTLLSRLEKEGNRGQRMTMQNSLEEIKAEYDSRTDLTRLEASIAFQRNALMTFVTGVEILNDKVGHRLPVKPRLKGWSESVQTNMDHYDPIFTELYDMYKDKANVHPLMKLVGTLGLSATMYHITNTAAERSGIPHMSEILHENPELMRQFAQATAARMGGGLGNLMGTVMSGDMPGGGGAGFGGGGGPSPYGMPPPPPSPPRQGANTRVPFNMATSMPSAKAADPPVRREMRGPAGVDVDDILKSFEKERLVEVSAGNPVHGAHASLFAPSAGIPTPPRSVSILREDMNDPLASFMTRDDQSVGTTSTMNTERRRGRPRAVATPVGATLNLNV